MLEISHSDNLRSTIRAITEAPTGKMLGSRKNEKEMLVINGPSERLSLLQLNHSQSDH